MSARLVGEVIPKVYSLCSLWAVNSVRHVFGGLRGGDARFRTEAYGRERVEHGSYAID